MPASRFQLLVSVGSLLIVAKLDFARAYLPCPQVNYCPFERVLPGSRPPWHCYCHRRRRGRYCRPSHCRIHCLRASGQEDPMKGHEENATNDMLTGTTAPSTIKDTQRIRMMNRRDMMNIFLVSTTATAMTMLLATPSTVDARQVEPLEQLGFANGEWRPLKEQQTMKKQQPEEVVIESENTDTTTTTTTTTAAAAAALLSSPTFATYLTRFLIHYDDGVQQWWNNLQLRYSLLSPTDQTNKLTQQFAALARSLQEGSTNPMSLKSSSVVVAAAAAAAENDYYYYYDLWDCLTRRYGNEPDAMRHITLLFALLPPKQQPMSRLRPAVSAAATAASPSQSLSSTATATVAENLDAVPSLREVPFWDVSSTIGGDELTALLPLPYHCELAPNNQSVVIVPDILASSEAVVTAAVVETSKKKKKLQEGENLSSATLFGPIAAAPLTRELPAYSPLVYALLGISGATGCALTHAVVIPLDVVKTRAQTNPLPTSTTTTTTTTTTMKESPIMIRTAVDIVQKEGPQALFLGAQATIVGYFWYGLSVYPSYTFLKRFLTWHVLSPDLAMAHGNDIALVAGALAAVVASLGLTPIEAARIRVVAEPETYRSMGLLGTLKRIASEGTESSSSSGDGGGIGWPASLYAGLPSLLARQVIFGSVKFLAFERACDFLFALWPFLRDATWTSLGVSLVAGGFSGALSSVVSQPADSLLTFVAQNSNNGATESGTKTAPSSSVGGLLEGCRIMMEREGPGSLFRGLGSRCVWAGSIIAGQFLLYDVFRTWFHVSTADLSQVYQVVVDLSAVS